MAAQRAKPTEITALLGRGTRFEGKLWFEGRVRIDGEFKGDISGDDVLVIGEGALVEGTIEVGTCIVTAGEVRADVRGREAIELYSPGKIIGSLHAPAVFIDRGAEFEGTCTMAPLEPRDTTPPVETTVSDTPAEARAEASPTAGEATQRVADDPEG